jgi:integrase
MLGMAARHGAIATNPVISTAPIPKPEKQAKAWTLEEVGAIRTKLKQWDAGKDGSGRIRVSDLADPVDFLLGSGVRPGEVFAVRWPDIDFTVRPITARIHGTVVRSETYGLRIQAHEGQQDPCAEAPGVRRRDAAPTPDVSDLGPRVPVVYRDGARARQLPGAVAPGARRYPFFEDVPKTFRSSVATLVSRTDGADAAKRQLGHSSVTITERFCIEGIEQAPDVTATLETFNVFAPTESQKD